MEPANMSLLQASVVAVHAAAAFLAVLLGMIQLLRTRGDHTHRIVGRVWVAAMVCTCLTSFGIVERGFTWLHGLSLIALASLALGVIGARRKNLHLHVGPMIGSYVGTVIACVFAVVVPARLIPTLVREQPMLLIGIGSLVGVLAAAVMVVAPYVARDRASAAPLQ